MYDWQSTSYGNISSPPHQCHIINITSRGWLAASKLPKHGQHYWKAPSHRLRVTSRTTTIWFGLWKTKKSLATETRWTSGKTAACPIAWMPVSFQTHYKTGEPRGSLWSLVIDFIEFSRPEQKGKMANFRCISFLWCVGTIFLQIIKSWRESQCWVLQPCKT